MHADGSADVLSVVTAADRAARGAKYGGVPSSGLVGSFFASGRRRRRSRAGPPSPPPSPAPTVPPSPTRRGIAGAVAARPGLAVAAAVAAGDPARRAVQFVFTGVVGLTAPGDGRRRPLSGTVLYDADGHPIPVESASSRAAARQPPACLIDGDGETKWLDTS